ncbi:MAG: trehalose-phosphatase [Streptosporangiales bacterium]|nr:trehalose-phosphatase [Streptosporangiales bacterium]
MSDAVDVPRTAAGRAGLRALRDDPTHALVATDFDGTLAPIVDDPERARPVEGTAAVLRDLTRVVGTTAVVTGRPAATAVAYAGLAELTGAPGLVVLGHYGDERWTARTGAYENATPPPGLAAARAEIRVLLRDPALPPGVTVEDKGTSVAVHLRNAADPAAAAAVLEAPLRDLAGRAGLAVQPGRHVFELRGASGDKGTALRGLVAERAATAVLFAGDDLGDLPAFAAVEELRAEGIPGLTVASVGPEPVPPVTDRADLVLDGPVAVVAFLRALVSS